MLLAEDHLPTPSDLTIIQNLPSNLSLITSCMEQMVSEDLAYNILHCVNSLTNDLIGPSIPRPASVPTPGLAMLLLPPWVKFPSSYVQNEPADFPHLETYDILLEPLVHPAGISCDVTLSKLTWMVGIH